MKKVTSVFTLLYNTINLLSDSTQIAGGEPISGNTLHVTDINPILFDLFFPNIGWGGGGGFFLSPIKCIRMCAWN